MRLADRSGRRLGGPEDDEKVSSMSTEGLRQAKDSAGSASNAAKLSWPALIQTILAQ
jgi:hypothetical protein